MSENDIILNCQKGEPEAFGMLYDEYAKPIYRFIFYKIQQREMAEDLTSQTFLKALEGINKFNLKKGSFKSWIYKIARNNVIDHYRSSKPTTDIDEAWGVSSSDDVEQSADFNLKLEKVNTFLQTLKPYQREVVLLRVWENLPFKEIAEVTGKSEAACKMTFKRVSDSMRHEILILFIVLFFNINV